MRATAKTIAICQERNSRFLMGTSEATATAVWGAGPRLADHSQPLPECPLLFVYNLVWALPPTLRFARNRFHGAAPSLQPSRLSPRRCSRYAPSVSRPARANIGESTYPPTYLCRPTSPQRKEPAGRAASGLSRRWVRGSLAVAEGNGGSAAEVDVVEHALLAVEAGHLDVVNAGVRD